MTHLSRLALAALALAALPVRSAEWSDTFMGYRYGTQFREPGIDGALEKNILQLGHASGWAYGSHFFNADMLLSDRKDPSANSQSGATEAYVVYRGSLSLGKLSGKDVGFGPVKDVSLTAGFDLGTKNNAFASKKRFLMFGPTFALRLPKGFLDLGVAVCHEQNHNGIVGRAVDFRATFMATAAWGVPFQAGPLGLEFKGYVNHIGAKGKDGFGVETKPETLANAALLADLGALAGGPANRVMAGLGFEYWNNKFGGPNSSAPEPATNRSVSAPMAMLQIHF